MPDVGIGQTYTARVTVRNATGALVNADAPPDVTFTDNLGGTYGPFQGTNTATGRYEYDFAVPNDEALIGQWVEYWEAVLGGATLTGQTGFDVGAAGSLELDEAWGMTPEAATTLTGSTITAADLAAAIDDLVDYLGWEPDADDYPTIGTTQDWRARQFGRAMAWQAAYRTITPRTHLDGRLEGISAESLGDYSISRVAEVARFYSDIPNLSPRARQLINRSGLVNRTGRANARTEGRPDAYTAQAAETG